jgi:type I restriction enzyme M protein
MLHNNPELKSLIDKLWDRFWSGGIANPLTAIEQITYLLFMKRLDDLDMKRKQDSEFTGEVYKSIFAGEFSSPIQR